jgi:methionine sulfoxide reductase heme-binding subunit
LAVACASPAGWIAVRAARGGLGANPIERILNDTGWWTLTLLLVSLVPTPIRMLTGWGGAVRWRRMVGLFAFGYAVLHFATYAVLDQTLDLPAVVEDIAKRPFIAVGFAALVLLVPLAVTSNDRAVRRLGFVRWQRWHRLVYASSVLGVIHFVWRVKADLREPLLFASALAVLLGIRVVDAVVRRMRRPAMAG